MSKLLFMITAIIMLPFALVAQEDGPEVVYDSETGELSIDDEEGADDPSGDEPMSDPAPPDDPCASIESASEDWAMVASGILINGGGDEDLVARARVMIDMWPSRTYLEANSPNEHIRGLMKAASTAVEEAEAHLDGRRWASASREMVRMHEVLAALAEWCRTDLANLDATYEELPVPDEESDVDCGFDPPTPRPLRGGGRSVYGTVDCDMYTVARGDTMWRIAWAFGHGTLSLCRRNGVRDCDEIEIGDRIRVRFGDEPRVVPESTDTTEHTDSSGDDEDQPEIDCDNLGDEITAEEAIRCGIVPSGD